MAGFAAAASCILIKENIKNKAKNAKRLAMDTDSSKMIERTRMQFH